MTGATNLEKLLSAMNPVLLEEEYVFCCFEHANYGDHSDLAPIAAFREREGLTLVIAKSMADKHQLDYESVFKGITLQVHSSLDAVGLTAAVTAKLTEHSISANVIAAYFHDHIFVGSGSAEEAMRALGELAAHGMPGPQ